MTAGGYNAETGKYDAPAECPHVCPKRADAGDYELCLCCTECMAEGANCQRERPGG